MLHTVLKSKLHRATITEANLDYEGSCTIDMDLVELANMSIHEQVHIADISNGERFITYIIPGERGSGVVCLNGACARLAHVGDEVIIMTYGQVSDEELKTHEPTIVVLDNQNTPKR